MIEIVTDKVFIDSNLWLYALAKHPPSGDVRHEQAMRVILSLENPVISTQVIREVGRNLLKKQKISEDELCGYIQDWHNECEVVTPNLTQELTASKLRVNHCLSYWDSLIVSAALNAHCRWLYSEDMQHGLVIENCLTIINPFTLLASNQVS
jgi:predicted nucleic acid-binding protein